MAINHSNKTVGTSPTLLLTIPAGNPYTVVNIYNEDNSSIYIGDDTVTSSGATKGLQVKKDTPTTIWLHANDALYAVSAAGTAANAVTTVYSTVLL